MARVILLILLLTTVSCSSAVTRQRLSKALMSEAYELIKRDTDLADQWTGAYKKAFTPENRAQFPANRDFLRTHAAQIIKILDESSSLNNGAADRYEQAADLSGSDQQHKGLTTLASGFRKTVEMNELLKSQMQIVSDDKVVDKQLFNEKFLHLGQLIAQKLSESQNQFGEGKRLLGWEIKKSLS